MNKTARTDEKGRISECLIDEESGMKVIIGPPAGLVDRWPEPFATRLHNILYARGILTYEDVTKNPKELQGALQEALEIDAQTLSQLYYEFLGS